MNRVAAVGTMLLLSLAPSWAQAPFSHRYHIEEESLKCADCHEAARSAQSADDLNPGEEACLDCHDPGTVQMEWPVAEREYFFSHRQHGAALDLECADCHGAVARMEAPGPGALPAMDQCMTCHNGLAAPRDCASCHATDRALLLPASHQPGWKEGHGQVARLADNSCLPCHAVSDCQECHEGALLHEVAALRQTPFASELEGSRGTILQRVHGLNYRFWHALEARAKGSDCLTCHELDAGDFCADCHNPAQDQGLRPLWHGGPDWGALAGGVGTGGGRHAELARRDLENCVSCHDQAGEDPSCLLCHLDRTPGRGNDPRTHSRGFAEGIPYEGPHDGADALCFTCHIHWQDD
jgi:hypothetical protein